MARTKGATAIKNRVKHYEYTVMALIGSEYKSVKVTTVVPPDKCTIRGADGKSAQFVRSYMA